MTLVRRSFKAGSATPSTPFLIPIIVSIRESPSKASLAYLTVPGKTSARSFSTNVLVRAAPPRITGHLSAKPRLSNSSKFSFIITVDLTKSPLIPMTSTEESWAASII